jgi:hypothetical protein
MMLWCWCCWWRLPRIFWYAPCTVGSPFFDPAYIYLWYILSKSPANHILYTPGRPCCPLLPADVISSLSWINKYIYIAGRPSLLNISTGSQILRSTPPQNGRCMYDRAAGYRHIIYKYIEYSRLGLCVCAGKKRPSSSRSIMFAFAKACALTDTVPHLPSPADGQSCCWSRSALLFSKRETYKSSSSSSCLLLGNELSHHLPFDPTQSSSLCQTHTNTWTIIVPANKTTSWPKVESKKNKNKKGNPFQLIFTRTLVDRPFFFFLIFDVTDATGPASWMMNLIIREW